MNISKMSPFFRAVAPDMKGNYDAAERRRQIIQESKFLGGDMEHTHLVKGLDFALLQKVRSEIINREKSELIDTKDLEDDNDAEDSKSSKKDKKSKKDANSSSGVGGTYLFYVK